MVGSAKARAVILLALVLGAGLLYGCAASEEELAPAVLSPSATSPAAVAGTPTPTASPAGTPSPTAPADWATYADPDGRFTLRYPPGWYAENGVFSTFKLGSVGPTFPPGAMKIDVSFVPRAQLGSCETNQPASRTSVASKPAQRLIKNITGSDVTLTDQIWIDLNPWCVGITAQVAGNPDGETLFNQFLASLEFSK
jgi:hypothetical protein